jgi:hypothetical protein
MDLLCPNFNLAPNSVCALEELRALLHIYYRAINLRSMYCTGQPFLFLLGRATYIEFIRSSYGPGQQGLCIFPCSLLNHNQSTHTKKKYIKMKENYCSILEYISMFELMDREYNTSFFFQRIRNQITAGYSSLKCPTMS